MKMKYEFEIVDIAGEKTLVPIDSGNFKGIIRMNDISADIVNLLKADTTEDAIVTELLKEYNAVEADIRESTKNVLHSLRSEGLLEE